MNSRRRSIPDEIIHRRGRLRDDTDQPPRIGFAAPPMKHSHSGADTNTTAPVSKAPRQRRTPARELAASAGLTIEQVAAKARMTPAHFGLLARRGKAPCYTADKLSRILNCHPAVFMYGLNHYQTYGAVGTPAASTEQYTVAQHRLRAGQRPSLQLK